MSPTDLTVKILREIRDELRESRGEQRELRMEQRLFREEVTERFKASDQRFETIETALRDMAEQLVMHGRALKVLLDARSSSSQRFDSLERRVSALEAKVS